MGKNITLWVLSFFALILVVVFITMIALFTMENVGGIAGYSLRGLTQEFGKLQKEVVFFTKEIIKYQKESFESVISNLDRLKNIDSKLESIEGRLEKLEYSDLEEYRRIGLYGRIKK